jgi:hypothetical protein
MESALFKESIKCPSITIKKPIKKLILRESAAIGKSMLKGLRESGFLFVR